MTGRLDRNGARPAPIVLGAHVNGLGLVRGLAEGGLASVVVSDQHDLAFDSRHAVPFLAANPRLHGESLRGELLALAARLPAGGVVFATSDEYLKALAPARDQLEKAGILFPMSSPDVLDVFGSKKKTQDLAGRLGVPTSRSIDLTGADVQSAALGLRFPLILKPEETVGFKEALNISRQTLFIDGPESLKSLQERLLAAGLGGRNFVLQEYIPGPSSNLYTISTFSDREGRIRAYSTGHKLRQHPPEAGTISQGYVTPTPELLEPTAQLFSALKFFGVANTEYKFDPRDGQYKLIEVNPRPGKWNSSATRTGVNLPLLAYRYVTEDILPPNLVSSSDTAVWTELFSLALSLRSEFGALGAMRRLIAGEQRAGKRIGAILDWNDPLPMVGALRRLMRLGLRGAGSRSQPTR